MAIIQYLFLLSLITTPFVSMGFKQSNNTLVEGAKNVFEQNVQLDLLDAIISGNHSSLEGLLAEHTGTIDINYKYRYNLTALKIASVLEDAQSQKILISAGAQIVEQPERSLHDDSVEAFLVDQFLKEYRKNKKDSEEPQAVLLGYVIKQDLAGLEDLFQKYNYSQELINYRWENGYSLLLVASWTRNLEIVEFLINCGAALNCYDQNGFYFTDYCTNYSTRPSLLFLLLKRNQQLMMLDLPKELQDRHLSEALILACEINDNKFINNFINSTHVDTTNELGESLLLIALKRKNYELAQKLIEKKVHLNLTDKMKNSPLIKVLKDEQVDLALLLLDLLDEAAINTADNKGNTPLIYAVKLNNKKLVKKLLDKKADPAIKNHKDKNAFSYAEKDQTLYDLLVNPAIFLKQLEPKIGEFIESNNINGLKQLLADYELDLNSIVLKNFTPLMLSVIKRNKDMVELLIQHKAYVDYKNDEQKTALFYAADKGYAELVDLLLKAGASTSLANSRGEDPLFCAIKKRHVDVVKKLLDKKASFDRVNEIGETPLLYAIEHGFTEIVLLLLDAPDCPINAQDPIYGNTALIITCKSPVSDLAIIIKLLEKGAQPGLANLQGKTAFSYCEDKPVLKKVLDPYKANYSNQRLGEDIAWVTGTAAVSTGAIYGLWHLINYLSGK